MQYTTNNVDTKADAEFEGWRLVVCKRKLCETPVKLVARVVAFGAQVVHLVVVCVQLVEKVLHVAHLVAVQALDVLGGVAHRNDAVCDVRQVEVIVAPLKALLLLAHKAPEHGGRHRRFCFSEQVK